MLEEQHQVELELWLLLLAPLVPHKIVEGRPVKKTSFYTVEICLPKIEHSNYTYSSVE